MIELFVRLALLTVAHTAEPTAYIPQVNLEDLLIGNCSAGDTDFNLSHLFVIESTSVNVTVNGERMRMAISGETLRVSRIEGGRETEGTPYRIGQTISPNEDIDIELRFAIFEGQLVLYWKETFQHRIYRQGLLRIGSGIAPLCEGRGGMDTSH